MADPLYVAHVVAFSLSAAACVAGTRRVSVVEGADARRGLSGFLLLSAGWAGAHVGYLLAPGRGAKYALYVAGLVFGFSTVFAWLYFCSAYAGRSFHRDRTLRRAALALFVAVVFVKVTNPLHGYYFEATMTATPFPHLAIQHGIPHVLTMGLSYVLATVGFFLLYEVFYRVGRSARPLGILAALFVAPLALDVLGIVTGLLVEITYEPLGVATFAVGVTVVYHTTFRAVQLAGEDDDPVLVLTDDGRIRDYNTRAEAAFPVLDGAHGRPLSEVLPAVARAVEDDADLVSVEDDAGTRHYQLSTTPPGTSGTGRVVTLTDVTERERYRRELERQNERLDRFASVVSHDLRNPLTVAQGRLEMAMAEREDGDENLRRVADALDRMDTLIDDVLALARQGETIDEPEPVSLAGIAGDAWALVETRDATLDVEVDLTVEADPDRLQQLLENLFRNAVEHGGADVTVTVGSLPGEHGFFVADDGPGVPPEHREQVFESGFTTAEGGTGFGLAIVAEIAEAHGWSPSVTSSGEGGARFEFRT